MVSILINFLVWFLGKRFRYHYRDSKYHHIYQSIEALDRKVLKVISMQKKKILQKWGLLRMNFVLIDFSLFSNLYNLLCVLIILFYHKIKLKFEHIFSVSSLLGLSTPTKFCIVIIQYNCLWLRKSLLLKFVLFRVWITLNGLMLLVFQVTLKNIPTQYVDGTLLVSF